MDLQKFLRQQIEALMKRIDANREKLEHEIPCEISIVLQITSSNEILWKSNVRNYIEEDENYD
jgi:hypothetical protein